MGVAAGAAGAKAGAGAAALAGAGAGSVSVAVAGGGTLYVVATPIGNCEDITARARRVLSDADIVAAEDTRTTKKLFSVLGIRNRMAPYHKFNESGQSGFLVSEMLRGKSVALVSDAGTPCISDPGHALVAAAAAAGIEAVSVCGASSVVAALSVSGFNFVSFAFYGFFPREPKHIREALRRAGEGEIPVSVFFESPRRIEKTLRAIIGDEALSGAEICLCNDLTKLHERIYRGSPQAVLGELEGNPAAGKGEYTLVVRVPAASKPRAGAAADGACVAGDAATAAIAGVASATVGGVAVDGTAAGAAPAPPPAFPAGQPAWRAAGRFGAAPCESLEAMLIDHAVTNGGSIKAAVSALYGKFRGKLPKRELYAAALSLKSRLPGLFPSDSAGTADSADADNSADADDSADSAGAVDSAGEPWQ
jgi:16S rRNA (cytidine1402-2'-O)-methyltransferase